MNSLDDIDEEAEERIHISAAKDKFIKQLNKEEKETYQSWGGRNQWCTDVDGTNVGEGEPLCRTLKKVPRGDFSIEGEHYEKVPGYYIIYRNQRWEKRAGITTDDIILMKQRQARWFLSIFAVIVVIVLSAVNYYVHVRG